MCSGPVRRSHGVSLKANVVLDLTAIPPVNRPCLPAVNEWSLSRSGRRGSTGSPLRCGIASDARPKPNRTAQLTVGCQRGALWR